MTLQAILYIGLQIHGKNNQPFKSLALLHKIVNRVLIVIKQQLTE